MPLLSKEERRNSIALPQIGKIDCVNQCYGESAKIRGNNKIISGACIKCKNPTCIRLQEASVICPGFDDFSYERNDNVCPVNAISWDSSKEMPVIDKVKCINCGLCSLMCPMGAIYSDGHSVYVAEANDDYDIVMADSDGFRKQDELISKLFELKWKHKFLLESPSVLTYLYDRIDRFDGRSMSANLLVRNIMIVLGYHCSISRMGDVYTRIDAVYSNGKKSDGCYGAIEIEFGKDTLDASRGILDDIAVLHSRSGIDKNKNTAIVVCLSFPNKRQGYLQVIKDINNVLGLKIQTISLGALLILAWNGADVDFLQKDFYVDFDSLSIRENIQNKINRELELPEGFLGVLEPEK